MLRTVPRSLAELQQQIETALAVPTPRTGAAFQQLIDAQRDRWRLWPALLALWLGLMWLAWSTPSWVSWLLYLVTPIPFVMVGSEYVDARRLARNGHVTAARVEPLGSDSYALHFDDARRALWQVGPQNALDPAAPVTVLFHPHSRAAFVFAFAAGVTGDVRQDARAKPPRAQLR
jgi:hypothetical protein